MDVPPESSNDDTAPQSRHLNPPDWAIAKETESKVLGVDQKSPNNDDRVQKDHG